MFNRVRFRRSGNLRCKWCDGTGFVKFEVEFDPDHQEPCPACHGAGEVEQQVEEKDLNYR